MIRGPSTCTLKILLCQASFNHYHNLDLVPAHTEGHNYIIKNRPLVHPTQPCLIIIKINAHQDHSTNMATGDGAPSIYREVQPSAGESGLVALVGVVEVAVVAVQTLGMGREVSGRDQYPDPHTKSSGGTSSSLKLFFSFDSKGLRHTRSLLLKIGVEAFRVARESL